MIVAGDMLAKSEAEITVANIATMLVSASRMISGEVVPNFEAIVEQNEISFAQKRKDVSTVRALLTDKDAVEPSLQKAAETIRSLRTLSEAMLFDAIATVHLPTKPLPEGTLLRDTLRRLHYVQKVVESAVKWVSDFGEHYHTKNPILYTKIQHELIRRFMQVVIQIQQAAVIIGKYRDMGDIHMLREMALDAQATLDELKEVDESLSEKRRSISILDRVAEEVNAAPKEVRQLASITTGLAIVVALSVVVIKLNALAPQVLPLSEPSETTSFKIETSAQIPTQGTLEQEKANATEPLIKSKLVAEPKQPASLAKSEETAPATPKPSLPISNVRKPDAKPHEASITQTKLSTVSKSAPSNVETSQRKTDPSLTPFLKKATDKPIEKATKQTSEEKSESPKVAEEPDATPQKNPERAIPMRKTIVIED